MSRARGLTACFNQFADRLHRHKTLVPTCSSAAESFRFLEPVTGLQRWLASRAGLAPATNVVGDASKGLKDGGFDVTDFPPERVRSLTYAYV